MSIWIGWEASFDSVVVEVYLKSKPAVAARTCIWIRKQDPQMNIPHTDSLLHQLNERNRKKSKENKKKPAVTGISLRLPGIWPTRYLLTGVSAIPGWNPGGRYKRLHPVPQPV